MSQHIDPDARRAMLIRERLMLLAFVVALVLAIVVTRVVS